MQCRFDSFSLPNPGTSKGSVLGTKSYCSDAGWTAADIQMLHLRTFHKVVNHERDIQKSTDNISQRCYQKEWVCMLMILNKPPKRCNTCRTNPSSQPLLPKRAPPPFLPRIRLNSLHPMQKHPSPSSCQRLNQKKKKKHKQDLARMMLIAAMNTAVLMTLLHRIRCCNTRRAHPHPHKGQLLAEKTLLVDKIRDVRQMALLHRTHYCNGRGTVAGARKRNLLMGEADGSRQIWCSPVAHSKNGPEYLLTCTVARRLGQTIPKTDLVGDDSD